MADPVPAVTVVILTHRRAATLRRCLDSLPAAALDCEGLLLVNGPEPGEAEGLEREATLRWPWLRVVAIPAIPRGAARNRATRLARGELVHFLDDDTVLPEGFFERLVAAARRHRGAPALGGPNVSTIGATAFQRAADFLLRSPVGAGPMRARYRAAGADRPARGSALMLCNLGVRRELFERHGLRFPDRCASAEENLLLARVERGFGRPVYCPSLLVHHERRGSFVAFCDQVFRSGLGRAQITRLDPRSFQLATLAPLGLALYAAALPWLRRAWPRADAPLLAYAAAWAFETARLAASGDAAAALWHAALLPTAHFCYAIGMARGVAEALIGRPSAASLAGEACALP